MLLMGVYAFLNACVAAPYRNKFADPYRALGSQQTLALDLGLSVIFINTVIQTVIVNPSRFLMDHNLSRRERIIQ